MSAQAIMDQLAAELSKPKPNKKLIKQLNDKLDQALGTTLEPEDTQAAEMWERGRRG